MPYIGNITQDFNVSNAMLDTDSVTSIKIVDGTIEGADIAANLDLSDTQKIRLGAGNDLQIFHDGSNSFINEVGTGGLYVRAQNTFNLQKAGTSEFMLKATSDGAVELYYDNTKRLETDASGVKLSNGRFYSAGTFAFIESSDTSTATLTLKKSASGADSIDYLQLRDSSNNIKLVISGSGDIDIEDNSKLKLGTSDDLQIYHDGSNSRIHNATGSLIFRTGTLLVENAAGNENIIYGVADGAVQLYYDASKKFETTSAGSTVTGALTINNAGGNAVLGQNLSLVDSGKVKCGNNDDLQISHDGTDSIINNFTGSLKFQRSGSTKILFDTNGDLGFVDSRKAYFGDGADLQIYHDASNSYIVDQGTGSLVIQGSRTLIRNSSGHIQIDAQDDVVELYYDNAKKFETESLGARTQGRHLILGHSNIDSQGSPLLFLQDSTNTNTKAVFLLEDDYTTGRGALAINVGESGVTNDRDLMLQRAGGKVGVRCTPTESFEVSGTSKFNGAIKLGDDNNLKLGAGEDLQIYHASSDNDSYIKEAGTGRLQLWTSSLHIKNQAGDEINLVTNENGNCELWFDNSKKLETTSTGITVSGTENKFTSGTNGDCKLIIEADTDNNNEDDNPLLIFRQDGGLDLSVIGTGLTGTSSDNHLTLANSAANGGISFRTGTGNGYTNAVERMRVLAGGGLTFNGDTSTNNALSDYEQGTWTPTAQYNSGSYVATANAVCRYVKVGTLVHVSGRFSLTSDANGGSGELRIGGLPFAKGNPSADGNSAGIQIYVEGAASNITNDITGLTLDGDTQFLIRRSGTTASGNDFVGLVDAGTTLLVGGTYTTFG